MLPNITVRVSSACAVCVREALDALARCREAVGITGSGTITVTEALHAHSSLGVAIGLSAAAISVTGAGRNALMRGRAARHATATVRAGQTFHALVGGSVAIWIASSGTVGISNALNAASRRSIAVGVARSGTVAVSHALDGGSARRANSPSIVTMLSARTVSRSWAS